MKLALILLSFVVFLLSSEYEDYLKSQMGAYNQYKKSIDEEFSSMLKKQWEEFNAFKADMGYAKPKPKKIPKTKPQKISKKIIKKSPVIKQIKVPTKKPQKIKKIVKIKKPTKPQKYKKIGLNFYGNKITLYLDKNLKPKQYSSSKKDIIAFWEDVSKKDNKALLSNIKNYQNSLKLNDWALYKLSIAIGKKIYKNQNSATLFSWYILTKLGYDTKVAYNNQDIYLLATTKQKLYQVAFFKLDSKRYYVLSPQGRLKHISNVYTYSGNYPKADKKISLDLKEPIYFPFEEEDKKIGFKNFYIKASYNKNLVNFYKTYPQADYKVYFNYSPQDTLKYSLIKGLKPYIEGKSEIEAINFLLHFVQKSFKYKVDQEQFGYEKVFFVDETINYPYSDCEDRAIMFAFLVKNLLHLDTVGVKFSDHMATAVNLKTNINGSKFKYHNTTYTITDPTYINANAGMMMPQYKGKNFEVIRF